MRCLDLTPIAAMEASEQDLQNAYQQQLRMHVGYLKEFSRQVLLTQGVQASLLW
jgi:hypothetical protein